MNIVFLVACRFPYGNASSTRGLNICRLLHESGHKVHVISAYASEREQKDGLNFCTYECVQKDYGSFFKRWKISGKLLNVLKKYCNCNSVDAILTNFKYDRFNMIKKFCKQKNLRLYVENCEWSDYTSFKLRMFDFRFWQNQWAICHSLKKADGVISISRLLDNHNKSLGLRSVRIPTILDVDATEYDIHPYGGRIHIVYMGNPGRSKELLEPVIQAIVDNHELKEKIVLDIYGPTREQVLQNIHWNTQLLDKAENSLKIHGKKPQTEMSDMVRRADYTIFVRPDRRSSHAGFPTKFGETMTAGTPVITNDTGDVGLYLRDGQNGILVKGNDCEAVAEALKKVLSLPQEQYIQMRKYARETAEKYFNYKTYKKEIKTLLK